MPELQMNCYQTLEWGTGNLLLYSTRKEQPTTQKPSLSCSHSRTQVEAFEQMGEKWLEERIKTICRYTVLISF